MSDEMIQLIAAISIVALAVGWAIGHIVSSQRKRRRGGDACGSCELAEMCRKQRGAVNRQCSDEALDDKS